MRPMKTHLIEPSANTRGDLGWREVTHRIDKKRASPDPELSGEDVHKVLEAWFKERGTRDMKALLEECKHHNLKSKHMSYFKELIN